MQMSFVAVYATFAIQAALSALLVAVLLSLYRHHRHRYVIEWSLSGVATTIYFVGAIVALHLAETRRAAGMPWLAVSFTEFVAIYWAAAFLVVGAWEVATGREAPPRRAPWLFAALALVALAVVVIDGAGVGRDARIFARQGVRALLTGAAYLGSALILLRTPSWKQRRGLVLVSVLFAIYGLEQLFNFALAIPGVPAPTFAYYLGFLNIVLAAAAGVGMVVGMLEQERDRVRLAAEQIEHLAYHDGLTGLPNRRLLVDRLTLTLARADRGRERVAVLLVNIDRFKVVNDALGHTVGDELLRAFAERIRRAVRDGDTVARVAADEFALLLPGRAPDEDVVPMARDLLEELRRPFRVGEQDVFVSASIGLSLHPGDGDDAAGLMRSADIALSSAKEGGRDKVQLFAPAMSVQASERLDLEASLRRALAADEFVLHYQPIVDLRDGRVQEFEALVRWQHPQRGLLAPAAFLAHAESMGISDALDLWVVRKACTQAQAWHSAGLRGLRIAVNMSARAFLKPELVPAIAQQLRETGLEPEALELEITETIAMQNPSASLAVLRALRELGVRIAIDDFGTGHSSLSYLRSLPVDDLKIDQSFVRDMPTNADASAVTAAIIALAHSLRIGVVAEGVETEEQRAVLEQHDCDRVQGFLISRPLTAEACTPFLATRMPARRPGRRFTPGVRRERVTPI